MSNIKTISLTETELNQILTRVGSNITDGFGAIKTYVEAKATATSDNLKKQIEAGDKKLEEALNVDIDALKALKTILDNWDGTEDGALDLGKIRVEIQTELTKQGNRLTVTEGDISNIFGLLSTEKDERIKADGDLKTAIDKVIEDGANMLKSFEDKLTGVLARLSDIENALNSVIGLVEAGAKALDDTFNSVGAKAKEMFAIN